MVEIEIDRDTAREASVAIISIVVFIVLGNMFHEVGHSFYCTFTGGHATTDYIGSTGCESLTGSLTMYRAAGGLAGAGFGVVVFAGVFRKSKGITVGVLTMIFANLLQALFESAAFDLYASSVHDGSWLGYVFHAVGIGLAVMIIRKIDYW